MAAKHVLTINCLGYQAMSDAYVEHFQHVLELIFDSRKDIQDLLSTQEIEYVEKYLQLPTDAQRVYARLFMRKGSWFRVTSVLSYFPDDVDAMTVQNALQKLLGSGFIQTLSSDEDEPSQALEAVYHCASASEMQTLSKKVRGGKASSSKQEAYLQLKKTVQSQRRVDGSKIPLAQLALDVWKTTYPFVLKDKDILIVCLSKQVQELFRRLHRIVYLNARFPFGPTVVSTPKVESFTELLTQSLVSEEQDTTSWPGLMVIFNKVVYPDYKVSIATPLFSRPETWACFEIARQLHIVMTRAEEGLIVQPEEDTMDMKWLDASATPQLLSFCRLQQVCRGALDESDGWEMIHWTEDQATVSALTSLDDFVLEVRACWRAVAEWDEQVGSFRKVPPFLSKYDAGHQLARALMHASSVYEKMRRYQVSILLLNDLLSGSHLTRKRGMWWTRLAINLEHLNCYDQALSTCENGLKDPHTIGGDRLALEKRLERLQKRNGDRKIELTSKTSMETKSEYEYKKKYMVGRPIKRQVGMKSMFFGTDNEQCTVEQLVLQYYREEQWDAMDESTGGWFGVHSEGRVLRNLFGLLLWDVLYANVPDVFQSPYQDGPLDFGFAKDFTRAREQVLESRLQEIRHGKMLQIINDMERVWEEQYGKLSRFVSWPEEIEGDSDRPPLRWHQMVVIAMGQESLVTLLRHMATSAEYHASQSGLPDLLLLRAHKTGTDTSDEHMTDDGFLDFYAFCGMVYQTNLNNHEVVSTSATDDESDSMSKLMAVLEDWNVELKLVEVKGPRDRLSEKQLFWLQVLGDQAKIDVSVMHVVEEGHQLEKKQSQAGGKIKKPRLK